MFTIVKNFKSGHKYYKAGTEYTGENIDLLLKEGLISKDYKPEKPVEKKSGRLSDNITPPKYVDDPVKNEVIPEAKSTKSKK